MIPIRCRLEGCNNPVPPDGYGNRRYCCDEHRREAKYRQKRAAYKRNHGGAARFSRVVTCPDIPTEPPP